MGSRSKYAVLLDTVYQCANEHLVMQFSDLLQNAPAHLNTQLTDSMDPAVKERHLGLHHFISTNAENLRQAFFIAVNRRFSADSDTDTDTDDELSLVSEDEMEELVAITTIQAHAMNLYGTEVDHLEARLEYMEISDEYDINKDCLNPDKIGEAFQTTLGAFTLELADKLELYSLFETLMMNHLEPMYREINALLIDAGIMPTIVMKTNRHAAEDSPEIITRVSRSAEADDAVMTENVIPFPTGQIEDAGTAASQFMRGEYVVPKSAGKLPASFTRPVAQKESDGKQFYARDDVLHALSRLQNSILNSDETEQQPGIEKIKRSLLNEMAGEEGGVASKQVRTLDERSIDFVGLMFDAITQDESIAMLIKNLLLRLQIPVIKVAMSDERLFQHNKHPAREALDLITLAGKGVNEESDRLYSALENIVDTVLEQYDIDIGCFDQAVESLRNLIDDESRVAEEIEHQEQRKIVFNNAREIIVDEVKHITSQQRIPQNVMPLITKNWPSLMINRYVKHGKESWQWLESVMLMKLLIRCLQPIADSRQWQTVWDNHLALIEAVHDELTGTQQDVRQIEHQVEQLKTTFLELLDAYGYKLVEDARVTSATMFEDASAERDAEIAASKLHAANEDTHHVDDEELRSTVIADVAATARKKLERLPSDVHPGVWFEIFNGEDKIVRRLKLSVVLTEVAKLVFVDRKGVKVIEKDAEEFAAELDNERSRFIADHSTFDNALGKVISALAA